jgi:tetratricopeptide (TPR) repeat protein
MNKGPLICFTTIVFLAGISLWGLARYRHMAVPVKMEWQAKLSRDTAGARLYNETTYKINNCLKRKDWTCAAENLDALSAITPKDPTLWSTLGKVLYQEEKYKEALHAFEVAKSFGILDADAVTLYDRVAVLVHEDETLGNLRSPHFELGFENSETLAQSDTLFATLEHVYDSLCLLWNYYPAKKIPVILYQSKVYEGINPRPDWGRASFDGKIRIPLNIMENWPSQRPVLVHELAHAFIEDISKGKAPLWFQEGFAQMLDGTTLDSLTLTGTPPELSALQKSFAGHSDTTLVHELYAYSLLMATRLYQRAGNFSALKEFLESLTTNTNIPDAEKIETELHTRFNTGSEPLRTGL